MVYLPYDFDGAWMRGGGDSDVLSPLPLDPSDPQYQGGVVESWPLLTFLLADDVYRQQYVEHLDLFATLLHTTPVEQKLRQWQREITPFLDPSAVHGENAEFTKLDFAAFEEECEGLAAVSAPAPPPQQPRGKDECDGLVAPLAASLPNP
jgi:hypothetical protein